MRMCVRMLGNRVVPVFEPYHWDGDGSILYRMNFYYPIMEY